MNKVLISEAIIEEHKYNAGSKARADIETVFKSCGYKVFSPTMQNVQRKNKALLNKFLLHYDLYKQWIVQLDQIENNSIVVFQFPVRPHTLLFSKVLKHLKKKGCFVVSIIHDLESLRLANQKDNTTTHSKRLIMEEKLTLPKFDLIIAHNNRMKLFLVNSLNVCESKVETIDIFDYLLTDTIPQNERKDNGDYSIIIAGNLTKEKAGYIYRLPTNLHFELYGSNYQTAGNQMIHYNGAFLPEDLPNVMNGDFGLVWDGPEIDTCAGTYGDYLRYNNPHKTSLYLACGIPVIVWESAAMASFIKKNKCGISVKSLEDISRKIESLSSEDYALLKANSIRIGEKLRQGLQTKRLVNIIKMKGEAK